MQSISIMIALPGAPSISTSGWAQGELRQDVHRLAPILLEVLALELTALIDYYMF